MPSTPSGQKLKSGWSTRACLKIPCNWTICLKMQWMIRKLFFIQNDFFMKSFKVRKLENKEKFVNHKYKNKVEFGHNFYYFDIDKMC